MFGWLYRRRLRAAIRKQWTEPKKIVEYANPYGTTDVIVSVIDKNLEQVFVSFDVGKHVIRLHLSQDYDETNLNVKVHG